MNMAPMNMNQNVRQIGMQPNMQQNMNQWNQQPMRNVVPENNPFSIYHILHISNLVDIYPCAHFWTPLKECKTLKWWTIKWWINKTVCPQIIIKFDSREWPCPWAIISKWASSSVAIQVCRIYIVTVWAQI